MACPIHNSALKAVLDQEGIKYIIELNYGEKATYNTYMNTFGKWLFKKNCKCNLLKPLPDHKFGRCYRFSWYKRVQF